MEAGKAKLLVCVLALACTNFTAAKETNIFVTVFTQNFHSKSIDMHLYVASSRPVPVQVQVFAPYLDVVSTFTNFSLAPGQTQMITLPTEIQMPVGTLTSNRIVRVVADDYVTVLALNTESSNSDMYQVREVTQLGKEYIVVTPQPFGGASTVGIVSPYPDTGVKVTLPSSFTTISAIIDDLPQNLSNQFTLTLKENQTFQIQSKDDLSGTHVLSDKPIAVLAGVNRSSTVSGLCLDAQITQLLSVDKLGTQYIVFGFPVEPEKQDYIHVVSTEPNTDVRFEGTTSTIAQSREITRFRINRNQFRLLETSSPSVVAVSTESGKADRQGDVTLYSLMPLPLTGLQYTITIPDDPPFASSQFYLIIMVESDGVDDILLDDVTITGVTWQSVEGTNISACYHSVTDNMAARVVRHRTGKPFAAYLQGFDYCDAYTILFESYEHDVFLRPCVPNEVERRDMKKLDGRRMTSQRMKFFTVEFLSACFSHCLSYSECRGVNFSTEVTPGDVNCQLLFTQTDGQVDTAEWTYYQVIPN